MTADTLYLQEQLPFPGQPEETAAHVLRRVGFVAVSNTPEEVAAVVSNVAHLDVAPEEMVLILEEAQEGGIPISMRNIRRTQILSKSVRGHTLKRIMDQVPGIE